MRCHMKKDILYVKVDSRNRITIPKKLAKDIAHLYKVYEKDGNIVLEAVHEASKSEQWIMEPKNQAILERLKEEAGREETHHKPQGQQHNNQQQSQSNQTQNQHNNQHNSSNNNGSHNDKR